MCLALRSEIIDSDSVRVTTQMYFDGNQVNIENGKYLGILCIDFK